MAAGFGAFAAASFALASLASFAGFGSSFAFSAPDNFDFYLAASLATAYSLLPGPHTTGGTPDTLCE